MSKGDAERLRNDGILLAVPPTQCVCGMEVYYEKIDVSCIGFGDDIK